MKGRGILLLLLLSAGVALNGQYTKEFKRIFFDADYLMETGFYEEAYNRYKNLLTLDPGNYNILYHCGECCLNIPGKEEEAITYLKEAAEGITPSYKGKSHKESGAPVITYYLLGEAYHLNSQYSEAINRYSEYLEMAKKEDPQLLEYARMQIEACKRAANVQKSRPEFEFHGVLEHFVDDLPSCSNPVISGDGNTLVFLVDYPSDKKVMMSTRTDRVWSRPRVINSELGMVGETYPVSISYDGKDLYLVHYYYSHSDIFVSHLERNRWSEAEALGYQINGRTSETHASISKDGQKLYFTSNKRGGLGGFDIYVSYRTANGDWGPSQNLGEVINTPFEEYTPFIADNDSILFFSSQGHASMGGADVFESRLQANGTWSEPENLGYPVNTPGDDLFFNPGWNEQESYYAVRREDDPSASAIAVALKLEYEDEADAAAAQMIAQVGEPPEDSLTEAETQAMLVEPPNTDEIEMVLNDREPEPEGAPEPELQVATEVSSRPSAQIPVATDELTTMVPFETSSYDLNLPAQLEVEKIAELMTIAPDSRVELIGHSDNTGDEDYNMILSQYRAEKVAEYLELRGIDRDRILMEGMGESDPMAINTYSDGTDAPLGRYLNRQVHVKITGSLPAVSYLCGAFIPVNLIPVDETDPSAATREFHFTIQIVAVSAPIAPTIRFPDLDNVAEYNCQDGFYRYSIGSFRRFSDARQRLLEVRKMGYEDAFIQTIEWYQKACN